jgi:hypothetical protein
MPKTEGHRDKNGVLSRKHGNTLIAALRETYGPTFSPGIGGNKTLGDVLHSLDKASLSQLVRGTPR